MSVEQKIQSKARLNIRVAPGVDRQQLDKIVSGTPGIQSIIQTFPDETDEELSSLYMLEVDPDNLKAVLNLLRQNRLVQYAEETARRKLIR